MRIGAQVTKGMARSRLELPNQYRNHRLLINGWQQTTLISVLAGYIRSGQAWASAHREAPVAFTAETSVPK